MMKKEIAQIMLEMPISMPRNHSCLLDIADVISIPLIIHKFSLDVYKPILLANISRSIELHHDLYNVCFLGDEKDYEKIPVFMSPGRNSVPITRTRKVRVIEKDTDLPGESYYGRSYIEFEMPIPSDLLVGNSTYVNTNDLITALQNGVIKEMYFECYLAEYDLSKNMDLFLYPKRLGFC